MATSKGRYNKFERVIMTAVQEQLLFSRLTTMTNIIQDMKSKIEEYELFQPVDIDLSEIASRSCASRSTLITYLHKNFKDGEDFTQTIKNGKIKLKRDVALHLWRRYGKN